MNLPKKATSRSAPAFACSQSARTSSSERVELNKVSGVDDVSWT